MNIARASDHPTVGQTTLKEEETNKSAILTMMRSLVTSAVTRNNEHIEKVGNGVQQPDERNVRTYDYHDIKRENERLRKELSSMRTMVEVLQRKETDQASLVGTVFRNTSLDHASAAATVPGRVSPAVDDRHDEHSSHHSLMDEEDLSTSSCGLKHRKSPAQPHSRILDTSSLMENGKYAIPSHLCDGIETAPLVGSTKGPGDCNSPTTTFLDAVRDRASWLVGLLILQSMSSFIISRNENLLKQHLVIVQFLTMLVGAGGNGGNQCKFSLWKFPVALEV